MHATVGAMIAIDAGASCFQLRAKRW